MMGEISTKVEAGDRACGREGVRLTAQVVGCFAASLYKTFTTALRVRGKRTPFGGWRHHLSPSGKRVNLSL